MAVSPKVSIRKIGKAIGGLGRRKSNRTSACKDCPDHSRGLDIISESETWESSLAGDSSSFRVEDYLNETDRLCKKHPVLPPPTPEATECSPWTSPKPRRKALSPEDEAKYSPWSSPQLRQRSLVKADSWLFLSSARGFSNGESDSESESEEMENDEVAPLPQKRPIHSTNRARVHVDRRAALQRDDSWLTMIVEPGGESPPSIRRLRCQTKAREKFVATQAA